MKKKENREGNLKIIFSRESLRNKAQKDKIFEILVLRESSLKDVVSAVNNIRDLDNESIELVMDELLKEFLDRGLMDDDEPNKYGLMVDNLIGYCSLIICRRNM